MTEQSKEEQVGFHKGALSTLVKERQELAKMLNVVEQIMQMHIGALKELGVDLEEISKQQQTEGAAPADSNKSMDDMLN